MPSFTLPRLSSMSMGAARSSLHGAAVEPRLSTLVDSEVAETGGGTAVGGARARPVLEQQLSFTWMPITHMWMPKSQLE